MGPLSAREFCRLSHFFCEGSRIPGTAGRGADGDGEGQHDFSCHHPPKDGLGGSRDPPGIRGLQLQCCHVHKGERADGSVVEALQIALAFVERDRLARRFGGGVFGLRRMSDLVERLIRLAEGAWRLRRGFLDLGEPCAPGSHGDGARSFSVPPIEQPSSLHPQPGRPVD